MGMATDPGAEQNDQQEPAADMEDSGQADESNAAQGDQAEAAGATASESDDNELGELKTELSQALEQVADFKDRMLRMQAEMDNLRKRTARDLEKSRKFALERFMHDLLPVRDSLERGLEAAEESATVDSLKEGKTLILRMLTKAMQDHGLQIVDPQGEPFNPAWHEAMTMQPSDEHDENTVLTVLQKGFKLNDRLIRPAMVVVSKKS